MENASEAFHAPPACKHKEQLFIFPPSRRSRQSRSGLHVNDNTGSFDESRISSTRFNDESIETSVMRSDSLARCAHSTVSHFIFNEVEKKKKTMIRRKFETGEVRSERRTSTFVSMWGLKPNVSIPVTDQVFFPSRLYLLFHNDFVPVDWST